MKRPRKGYPVNRTGDIRKDFTPTHLASLGAVALAFNEADASVDLLLAFSLGLLPRVSIDVVSRINGLDGKVAIIKVAVKELGADNDALRAMEETLGSFMGAKKFRDACIHARYFDVPTGIASTAAHRGKIEDVLLTEEALSSLYDRLTILREELRYLTNIVLALGAIRRSDQTSRDMLPLFPQAAGFASLPKAALEQEIRGHVFQVLENQKKRQSLPPNPKFPSESEQQQAHQRWMEDQLAGQGMGWMVPFQQPSRRAVFRQPPGNDIVEPVPVPKDSK